MFDSFFELLFPAVYESAVLIDGVPYLSFQTVISDMGSTLALYGLVIGFFGFVAWTLLNLLWVLFLYAWSVIKRLL